MYAGHATGLASYLHIVQVVMYGENTIIEWSLTSINLTSAGKPGIVILSIRGYLQFSSVLEEVMLLNDCY